MIVSSKITKLLLYQPQSKPFRLYETFDFPYMGQLFFEFYLTLFIVQAEVLHKLRLCGLFSDLKLPPDVGVVN